MKFLAVYASSDTLTPFREEEFLAAAEAAGVSVTLEKGIPWLAPGSSVWFSVFHAENPSLATLVASRCMLLKGLYVLLATAPTLEALTHSNNSQPSNEREVWKGEEPDSYLDNSYSYRLETIGKRYKQEQKDEVLRSVAQSMNFVGPVDWKAPHNRFFVFIEHELQEAPKSSSSTWIPNGSVLRVFHCVLVCESARTALLSKYDLRKRPYIGTTSMPPEESFMMANFARVHKGDYVMDPFCGTGSLLVAVAHFGASTLGADADGRAMRYGSEKCRSSKQMQLQRQLALQHYSSECLDKLAPEEKDLPTMRTNFKIYSLRPPETLRMNFSQWNQAWRRSCAFCGRLDAIITDPPYGLREHRRRVDDLSKENDAAETELDLEKRRSVYEVSDMTLDLVLFAATHLKIGGFLTFWHATTVQYTDDELPVHPCMRIVSNIPQRLSLKMVRRLVTMQKFDELPVPEPTKAECAPKLCGKDLRKLMDETEVEGNADYMHYRERVNRRKEATKRYFSSTSEENAKEGEVHWIGDEKKFKLSRLGKDERQATVVSNRLNNIKKRKEKQAKHTK